MQNSKLGYQLTDGNRPLAYAKENNDCTVRGLSLFFGVDYEIAHKTCETYGRKNNHGMNERSLIKALKSLSRKTSLNAVQIARTGTVEKIVNKYPSEKILIHKAKHLFCIDKSIIKDTFVPSELSHVKHAWILKNPIQKIEPVQPVQPVQKNPDYEIIDGIKWVTIK